MSLEILSQIPTPQVGWTPVAVAALTVVQAGTWITNIIKYFGDRAERRERKEVVDKLDAHRQHTDDRIADAVEKQVVMYGDIKSELAKQHSLGGLRHEHVSSGLMAMQVGIGVVSDKLNTTCKGSCNLREPMIKPKNVFDKPTSFP